METTQTDHNIHHTKPTRPDLGPGPPKPITQKQKPIKPHKAVKQPPEPYVKDSTKAKLQASMHEVYKTLDHEKHFQGAITTDGDAITAHTELSSTDDYYKESESTNTGKNQGKPQFIPCKADQYQHQGYASFYGPPTRINVDLITHQGLGNRQENDWGKNIYDSNGPTKAANFKDKLEQMTEMAPQAKAAWFVRQLYSDGPEWDYGSRNNPKTSDNTPTSSITSTLSASLSGLTPNKTTLLFNIFFFIFITTVIHVLSPSTSWGILRYLVVLISGSTNMWFSSGIAITGTYYTLLTIGHGVFYIFLIIEKFIMKLNEYRGCGNELWNASSNKLKRKDKSRLRLFRYIMKLFTTIIHKIFWHLPMENKPVHLYHVGCTHLRKLNQCYSKSNKQRSTNKKNKKIIPLHFRGHLPFINVTSGKTNTRLNILIDTGCQFNIINHDTLQQIEYENNAKHTRFSHNLALATHTGTPLTLLPTAVMLPITLPKTPSSKALEVLVPFLIEDAPGSVNIIGITSLKNLHIDINKGFTTLEIEFDETEDGKKPENFQPLPDHFYEGTLDVHKDLDDSDHDKVYLDLPAFYNYTGCLTITPEYLKYDRNQKINTDSFEVHLEDGILIRAEAKRINHRLEQMCLVIAAVTSPCGPVCCTRLETRAATAWKPGVPDHDLFTTPLNEDLDSLLVHWEKLSSHHLQQSQNETEQTVQGTTDTLSQLPISSYTGTSINTDNPLIINVPAETIDIHGSCTEATITPNNNETLSNSNNNTNIQQLQKEMPSPEIEPDLSEFTSSLADNIDTHKNNTHSPPNHNGENMILEHDPFQENISMDLDNLPQMEGFDTTEPFNETQLEIQLRDTDLKCLLCTGDCHCTTKKQPTKIFTAVARIMKRKQTRIYKVCVSHQIICLIVKDTENLPYFMPHLSEKVYRLLINHGKFSSYRIGNQIDSEEGLNATAYIYNYITNLGWPVGVITYRTTPKEQRVHHMTYDFEQLCYVKSPLMQNDTVGLPENLTEQSEILYLNPDEDVSHDLDELINTSNVEFQPLMRKLFKIFPQSYIKSPTDFGKLTHEDFLMDLKIKKDHENLLPQHSPFPASTHLSMIVDKLVDFWIQTELVGPSTNKDWASRIIIVRKKISQRNYLSMRKDITEQTEYKFKTTDSAEMYGIDAKYLTVKQLCCIFRICLDARDINRITEDALGISQNPELTLFNLQMTMGKNTDHNPVITLGELRQSDPYIDYQGDFPAITETEIQELTHIVKNTPMSDQKLYYTSLDISAAHTSVSLTDKASDLLNFITPSLMLFKFLRACFGLKIIAANFNSVLVAILHDLIKQGLLHVYADDIILTSSNRTTHMNVLICVVERFAKHGLRISLGKSHMGMTRFKYLGFEFDQQGITLSEDRISGITNFPPPKDKKGVQRLLGTLQYISKFVPQYSFNLFPLINLLSVNKNDFKWTEECQNSLDNMKTIIKQNLQLHYVPEDVPLWLYVDSSLVSGGSVLFCGTPGTPDYKPIAYFSKKYSNEEIAKQSSLEAEATNLLYSIEKVRHFLDSHRKVTVRTDAKTILYLIYSSRKCNNAKLARLASKISEYVIQFSIEYCPPTVPELQISDTLSRQYYNEVINKWPGKVAKLITKDMIETKKACEQGYYDFNTLANKIEDKRYVTLPEEIEKLHNLIPGPTPTDPLSDPPLEDQPGNNLICDQNTHTTRTHDLLVINNIKELTRANIINEQRTDPIYGPIIDAIPIEDQFYPSLESEYIIKNGQLYQTVNGTPRLCIPASLTFTLITGIHINYGHIGVNKLWDLIKLEYTGTNLRKQIIELTQGCHLCRLCKPNHARNQKITGFRTALFPNQTWSIDFAYMQKANRSEYILVIQDTYSGYIILHKCRNMEASQVIDGLKRAFLHLSPPLEIRSDNQTSLLKNKKVRNFLDKYNVQYTLYAPHALYHNAKLEASIGLVRKILLYYQENTNSKNWTEIIIEVSTLLNVVPKKLNLKGETKYISPFELFFGRKSPYLQIPHDFNHLKYDELTCNGKLNNQIQSWAKEALIFAKQTYLDNYNPKTNPKNLSVGDFFLVRNLNPPAQGGTPLKYQIKYKRIIYICTQLLGKSAIGLDMMTGNEIFTAIDNTKRYLSRKKYFGELPTDLKKHVGGTLELNMTLENRKIILNKLQDLGFYKDITHPASISEKHITSVQQTLSTLGSLSSEHQITKISREIFKNDLNDSTNHDLISELSAELSVVQVENGGTAEATSDMSEGGRANDQPSREWDNIQVHSKGTLSNPPLPNSTIVSIKSLFSVSKTKSVAKSLLSSAKTTLDKLKDLNPTYNLRPSNTIRLPARFRD